MGLFGVRCAASQLYIDSGPCCVVLLRSSRQRDRPVSLPLWGEYNGHGGIENVIVDRACQSLIQAFDSLAAAGRLSVNERIVRLPRRFIEPSDVLSLLFDGGANLACDGKPIVYSIMYAPVAKLLMSRPSRASKGIPLSIEPARTAIGTRIDLFQNEVRDMARLDGFLGGHWSRCETALLSQAEARDALSAAYHRYQDDRELILILNEYQDAQSDT